MAGVSRFSRFLLRSPAVLARGLSTTQYLAGEDGLKQFKENNQMSNKMINANFTRLYSALNPKTSSIAKASSASVDESVKGIIEDSLLQYTKDCRFYAPGFEVMKGREAFGEVLKEYTGNRGLNELSIESQEIGPLGSDGDTFYEAGITVFKGPSYYQKNNHLSIRKKTEVDGKTMFLIDVLIFNEIESS